MPDNRSVRRAIKGCCQRVVEAQPEAACSGLARCDRRPGASQCPGRKSGKRVHAIGRTRDGQTKTLAAAKKSGKPIAFRLSTGDTADLRNDETVIETLPDGALVIADHAFEADRCRVAIIALGAVPKIPPKTQLRCKSCLSPALSFTRNAIEGLLCRLQDVPRVATRSSCSP